MDSFSCDGYNSPGHFVSDIRNTLFSRFRDYGEFLLYSSLFLGSAAVGMAYTSCFIQDISWTNHIAAVMFLIVFSVYNLNRKTDEVEDALNHERRFRITKKFERHLFIAALGAYLTALTIAAFYGIAAFCVVMIPLISGIFYSVPILPKWCGYRRLKEIPVMKNLVVSISWALAFSLVPVYLSTSAPGAASLVVFMFIFCWTFVASVLPDIRDRTGDFASGVATIPVLVGVGRSRSILTIINISAGALILIPGSNVIPVLACAIIITSLVYSQVCIISIDRTTMNDLLCDVISDGQFLTIGGLCLLISSVPYLQF
ncbi:MAG: UbiA family prenyltransferase [Methanoregula sp.]|nr:UbiA family prenyltransferase [Methanoregula sp.]